ncbi:MAG: carbohydrate ABC transporter permease [Lacrimispora sp.]|uniref:carbohydrate ABC transporter permease n=1 Tax=Lacrimispora sp. TaxID=2719234 RepID=UPI0039E5C952
MSQRKILNALKYVILLSGAVTIILPLILVVMTAFKSNLQIAESWFSLPVPLYLDNFKTLFDKNELKYAFINSVLIAGVFLFVSTVTLPLTAYGVSRTMANNRFLRFFYYFLIIGLFVPFQAKMIPLIIIASKLGMMNVPGIIVLYIAGSTCEGVFLCAGYLQSIPPDMEEAAYIDGAGFFGTYSKVILPLMKPILATVAIQNALWVWNDFQLPLLVLNKSSKFWTLILYVYNFKTAYQTDFGLIFASFLISMLPIMVFYILMQKQIIGGLTAGAVKG